MSSLLVGFDKQRAAPSPNVEVYGNWLRFYYVGAQSTYWLLSNLNLPHQT